jgi:hypothetical protein
MEYGHFQLKRKINKNFKFNLRLTTAINTNYLRLLDFAITPTYTNFQKSKKTGDIVHTNIEG